VAREKIKELMDNGGLAALIQQQAAEALGEKAPEIAAPASSPDVEMTTRRSVDTIRRAFIELNNRKLEALRLYEPLPVQADFHKSQARQRVVRGSNRAGKTLAAAVEVARALTGQDPHGKYPLTNGRWYAVGLDLNFIGQVIFKKLFRAGAFKIIPDKDAPGGWRAYRPWDVADLARRKEAKPAPPLIPPRLIESIAWEDKGKGIPKMVVLKNGWELSFYSSAAKPPQGMDLDGVWFSEEIEDDEWYPEMVMRLLDRGGRFIWDATPQAGTDKLLELSEMAEAKKGQLSAPVEEFVVLLADNPHIEQAEKDLLDDLLTEDQKKVRVGGEFAVHGLKVFPEFQVSVHCKTGIDIDGRWTKYLAVDPGRQVCAVLFGAVPPPGTQPFDLCLYRELYIRNCSAEVFGDEMAKACRDEDYELFVIDGHMGRQTEMGAGKTVEDQYAAALKARKVACRRTGHRFLHGIDDVQAGLELCRAALRIDAERDPPSPRVVLLSGKLPNFVEEIKKYKYKRTARVVSDVPEDRGAVHLMATFRYMVGCKPKYVKPKSVTRGSDAYQHFQNKQKKARQSRES
jgi:hypothetical protein